MNDATKNWTIKTFEENGTTTVRKGLSEADAVVELRRAMGLWSPERKAAQTIPLRTPARAEKVAA